MATPNHEIIAVTNYDQAPVKDYGVIFIDHGPAKARGVALKKFRGHADIFVCHDSEDTHCEYWPYASDFKYRADCYRLRPATTALSDTTDLSFLHLPGDLYARCA